MNQTQLLEAMAFKVHNADHVEFEKVSKHMSDILGEKYTLFYPWCPKCQEIINKEKENKNDI